MPIRRSRMSRKEALQQQKRRMTEDDSYKMNKGGLSSGQAKIAAKAPPPNVINEKDFAVLRKEKAKGRGMGLQDEKVQPGKVMKARKGKMTPIKKDPTTPVNPFEKRRKQLGGGRSKLPGKIGTALGAVSMLVPAAYAAAKQYKDYKSAKNRDEAKVKKMGGGMMKKYSKGSEKKLMTPEERADYVKKAKVRLKATAESLTDKLHPKKSDRLFSKHKKMGGGMMQKPIGYKSGMGPAGAAGRSAGRPSGRRPMQQGPKGGIGSLSKKRSNDDLLILVNSGDGKIKKMKRSDFEDNMSAPEKKMGGGMMKARRGRIVDDQKRDKRNPNRKPSTKIFDKIGDILKTPYYIRGGKKEKKMGGGMMKKYSKGGGADSGRIGEMKSKLAVAVDKLAGGYRRDKDRLTDRDKEFIRRRMAPKSKMGGGMIAQSQRPGYSKGTMVKARGCKLGRTRPTKIT